MALQSSAMTVLAQRLQVFIPDNIVENLASRHIIHTRSFSAKISCETLETRRTPQIPIFT
ncbi:MAG: hypothetical protein K6G44_12940 [Lentisphaeria bacterium]|nr:hypothetical protein [Lentisphaeria bacterium]